jgi:Photosynthetic reaction centre cytochrome C subunit
MKLNILRISIVILSCALATLMLASVRAERVEPNRVFTVSAISLEIPEAGQSHSASAAQEKTVEQVQKNIKVLTGMPQSQLIPVMNFFAASMGRRCTFCHVNNNGQWDFASDEKPEKNRAREMIKMVLDADKATFNGNPAVSCWTCHRGSNQPQGVPPLPLPLPVSPQRQPSPVGAGATAPGASPQASPTPSPALPSADEILAKYTAAVGGQAAIDKIKTRTMKGSIAFANGNTGTVEIMQSAPDKGWGAFVMQRGSIEQGTNGMTVWAKDAQGVRELSGQQATDLKLSMQLFRNLKLKDQYSRLRAQGKEKIADRDTYVLAGSLAGADKVERLFFDADTGLLVRRISYTRTMIGLIPDQIDFEDYADVDGVKLPFTIRALSVDAGNPFTVRKFTEIRLNVPVDDSKFNMPPAPPKPATTPELTSTSEAEMQRHVGGLVTMRGRFSLRGKTGPFILVGDRPVYLEARGSFSWGERYATMEGRDVTVTGVLRFARGSPGTTGPAPAAGVADHFYFEAETAKVELSPA